jgi:multiple sugar transport system substrate-binding protein
MIELHGMSWDHPRGHDSIVATANAFMASNPGVKISWQTRSLQDFADYPIEKLAETFDFILIDHPFVGLAAASGCVLPVEQHLHGAFLADQAANSVGPSHESYLYDGHQWALATDAASQVSAYRPDLLEQLGVAPPHSWDAVLELAQARAVEATARVAVPLIPVDTLMCFCSLCANLGAKTFVDPAFVVSRPMGHHVLELLRQLKETAHPESTTWNPIRTFDRMSTTDEIA